MRSKNSGQQRLKNQACNFTGFATRSNGGVVEHAVENQHRGPVKRRPTDQGVLLHGASTEQPRLLAGKQFTFKKIKCGLLGGREVFGPIAGHIAGKHYSKVGGVSDRKFHIGDPHPDDPFAMVRGSGNRGLQGVQQMSLSFDCQFDQQVRATGKMSIRGVVRDIRRSGGFPQRESLHSV